MGWVRSLSFILALVAIVFVLENISLLRSRRSPVQGPKEHVPVEVRRSTSRIIQVMMDTAVVETYYVRPPSHLYVYGYEVLIMYLHSVFLTFPSNCSLLLQFS